LTCDGRRHLVAGERTERPAGEPLLVGGVLHLLFHRVDGHRANAHERVPKIAARLSRRLPVTSEQLAAQSSRHVALGAHVAVFIVLLFSS